MKKAVLLLVCVIFLTVSVSCDQTKETQSQETASVPTEVLTAEPENIVDFELSTEYGLNAFDESLIDYFFRNGYYDSDFVISPAGCRVMLCLAAIGAEGNTRTELIAAADFSGTDEMNQWYMYNQAAAARYRSVRSAEEAVSLFMGNAIWNDAELSGGFTESFQLAANERYNAGTYVCETAALTGEIDNWLSKTTNDLMTTFEKDVSGAESVLTSAVSMETIWASDFYPCEYDGVEMMEQTGEFLYANEGGTQVVVIPMQGGLSFVCFQGSRTNRFERLSSLRTEMVHVVLPEFTLRSCFSAEELLNFSVSMGVREALNAGTANFRPMCGDMDYCLQEMLHTATLSVGGGTQKSADAPDSPEADVKEFQANSSFSFIIFSDFGTQWQQALLYGQRMEKGGI